MGRLLAKLTGVAIPSRPQLTKRRISAILVIKRRLAVTLMMIIRPHGGLPPRPSTCRASPVAIRRVPLPSPITKMETGRSKAGTESTA